MARSNSNDAACRSFDSGASDALSQGSSIDPQVWLEPIPNKPAKQAFELPLIAQNLESVGSPNDRFTNGPNKTAEWLPDKIFLGIDATSSMSEQPLSGMSQFNANCAGDTESTVKAMSVDSRSKIEQLKDVLSTFISEIDDVKACSGRIFGVSVNPKTHEPFNDPDIADKIETGVLFGQGEEILGRRQIVDRIKTIQPLGGATAVALAIDNCRKDAVKTGSKRPLLALWTDGQENSGGNVCEEIEKFANEFPDGRIVVFGLDPTVKDQFDCVGLKALGNRFQYVDASDPNKSLEVLGKMSNHQTNGKLFPQELKGNALPYNSDSFEVNGKLKPPEDEEPMGKVYGELIRRRQPK